MSQLPGAAPPPGGQGHEREREVADAFGARALLFGALASVILCGPAILGMEVTPWAGVDGVLAGLLVLGVGCLGWPPPRSAPFSAAMIDLGAAVAVVGTFYGLSAPAWGGPAGAWPASGLAALLVLLGRRGGGAGVAAAAGAVALVAFGSRAQPGEPPVALAVEMVPVTLQLEGPLVSGRLRVGEAPPLELELDLGPGAERRVRAWIPAPADRAPGAVTPRVEELRPPGAAGRVRVEVLPAWTPDPRLVERQGPPAPDPARRAPSSAGLLGAWAGLLVTLGCRSLFLKLGRWGVVACALWACALLGGSRWWERVPTQGSVLEALGFPAAPEPRVRILEGELETGAWLQVDRGRRGLVLDDLGSASASLHVTDAGLRRCRLISRSAGEQLMLDLVEGGRWELLRAVHPGLRVLRPELNGWGPVEKAWIRAAETGWEALGSWELGAGRRTPAQGPEPGGRAPAPGPRGSVEPPPPWASSGAVGGPWVVVARLSEGAYRGLEGVRGPLQDGRSGPRGRASSSPVWVRLTSGPSAAGR